LLSLLIMESFGYTGKWKTLGSLTEIAKHNKKHKKPCITHNPYQQPSNNILSMMMFHVYVAVLDCFVVWLFLSYFSFLLLMMKLDNDVSGCDRQ